ncbi:TIGR01440 family protein [Bacillus methanolicus]|uniref:TIGR01440 family protein n=1 Tax=Bacillus methanolicus TaxID=1471 RepID=UPI00200D17F1|nr:TIGR01440 family protein [Bacillus methanolicus]UQD53593.1 TIGR01440 family protein [Bacillus methanolicus]
MSISQWEKELETILEEFKQQTSLTGSDIFVVGCSTSEVTGNKIGTSGTEEVAAMIFRQIKKFQEQTGVQLAFQCCEHLNRALVVERATALEKGLEEVSVIPVRNAGGAMATYAYEHLQEPVVVEFIKANAGIDIGDTFIGMHLKHVAVPVRVSLKQVGHAHVTLAKTRPKLIGGARAVYQKNPDTHTCH